MPPTVKKMSFREAHNLLNSLCLRLDKKPASTNKSLSETPNPQGMEKAWWVENITTSPPFDSARCKAYLKAYTEIAGPVFFGSGIPLERGLLHPDRGVMKAMLLAECVTLGATSRGLFELTQKGRDLIGDITLPDTSE